MSKNQLYKIDFCEKIYEYYITKLKVFTFVNLKNKTILFYFLYRHTIETELAMLLSIDLFILILNTKSDLIKVLFFKTLPLIQKVGHFCLPICDL